jgi:hypothetical protein
MYLEPTPPGATAVGALIVGGGYYVLDRLADPTEIVTLVRDVEGHGGGGGRVVVRSARGIEFAIAPDRLSAVPADEFYRRLRSRGGREAR